MNSLPNKKSLVSVILANYNNASYLNLCIKSLLSQTYQVFEIIIIDDASTDNSIEIINSWIKKDKRISLLSNSKNLGIASSRNRGISKANGKYIAIMDGDDVCSKHRLEETVRYLESHPQIYLVGSSVYILDEKNQVLTVKTVPWNPTEIYEKINQFENPFFVNTILFRNNLDSYYREKFPYCEDIDFYLNLISKGKKLRNLKTPLVYYRQNFSSVSYTKKTKMALFFEKAYEFYSQRKVLGKDKYDEFDPKLILNLDIPVSKKHSKKILEYEIIGKFQNGDYRAVKNLTFQFFRIYGFLNKNLYYHWNSSFPIFIKINKKIILLLEYLGLRSALVRKIIK